MKIKTHTTRYILFSLVILLAGCGSCAKSQDNSAFVPKDSSPSTSQTEFKGKWAESQVSEGLVFKSFRGYDEISGAEQIVSVLDVDLNSDRYEVKFDYHDRATTSATMAKLGAVGVVNGAYETESCYIKVDGIVKFAIPNLYIMNTRVPQWKSEAAVYTDGKQDVKIDFTAKDCNRDIEKTRAVYNKREEANILSSAPMLIDNYETVGANFVPDGYSQSQLEALNYEDPIRHQGVRHPRTAVALTKDKHFLMIVVDGRRPGIAEGMNARELTFFLKENFNPQYALNMDGGGSSTLCVSGQGDPDTHVVNYPTDGGGFDHTGERMLVTHIYVMDTKK